MTVSNETITRTITMDVLNNSEKLILLYLYLVSDQDGRVKIKNQNIRDNTGMAENTIGKGLENLEALGLITRGYALNRNYPGGIERTIEIIK